ncbi:16S rRNA (cytosine(1402)-N(4))-methyltransferase RsmH [Candidatus Macondimonas diazotrophica]|jgi:16S rRNA (cytosine1402-N4)-methyltransferase|uniref:Ribosomal RNA small subunit methyltransferase H n=1 Tax=Candidatus Macondimonas diazotrophica TaxID=2305248 RepID=A0A4Z0FBE4_9GAMM|nr:16S rRNA (cytosine(1402)-N(4))-methyltransferase RsmH [Candidatus Macondimonas diazotrophica]NCU00225.1 16S rRNA (cytosine(1402)-N(4))-methyltransferase RsmH [Candidatus Macondimonas diazotrophica]TFZ83018.1 16S rRNA (cytosine(1402)-N(4))-methyltransferase RsmH [Candidatus Macondimonas diazotrophica]HBG31731.1 16S rRNA (cytosine(1402)-N(4))-methyltransferase [Gammaproteobacteria bacterium]
MDALHQPVLLAETLEALAPRAGDRYIDGTYGRGGHAECILSALGPDGRLMVVDQDPEAIAHARSRWAEDARVTIVHANIADLAQCAQVVRWREGVQGILFDLGVSSPQLDDPARGFSFMNDGPLDMRMDVSKGQSAAQWLGSVDESELAEVLWRYGEERQSRRIARRIVAARANKPLTRTRELAEIVGQTLPPGGRHKHPATRTFQAIRIYINRELESLEQALTAAVQLLAPGGRLAVISFHSLEDRVVKRFMRQGVQPPSDPLGFNRPEPTLRWVAKQVRAGVVECAANPRARSATLRVVEKLG